MPPCISPAMAASGCASMPYYNASIGKLWLERGGTSVIANIRGGGEFGTPWHEAGRGAGKRLAHDDFAAVAADLVRRGVTRPERIAAEGGSNGGILITNMLTRYPERFGALFCTIPLIDMRRYSKLLAGASWIAEYGDPDKPEDWALLQTYSAYHQAVPGQAYPPILIATTRRDDRVHPGHARKMAAKLQRHGLRQAYFYEPRGRRPRLRQGQQGTRRLHRRSATRSSSRRSAGRAEPLGQHDVRPTGTVHIGQQPDDLVTVLSVEGEGVPARRRLCRRDVTHDVGPEVAAEQARAAVVVVAAEEERQHAFVAGAPRVPPAAPSRCRGAGGPAPRPGDESPSRGYTSGSRRSSRPAARPPGRHGPASRGRRSVGPPRLRPRRVRCRLTADGPTPRAGSWPRRCAGPQRVP